MSRRRETGGRGGNGRAGPPAGRTAGADGGHATAGAMPVVEAILVALLVLAAILFVSGVQRPLLGSEAGGVDLGTLSAQALGLLQRHNFTVGSGYMLLEDWANATMAGDNATATMVSEYLGRVLPPGTRHALYLTNGEGALRLAPASDPGLPRNGRAAEVPFLPHWGSFRANATPAVNATWAAPGQNVTVGHPVLLNFTDASSTVKCVRAPDGASHGPGHVRWVARWRDGGFGQVPIGVPYGVWAGYTDAACTAGPSYARVALKAGALTDYPLYGLRLVVWFGT